MQQLFGGGAANPFGDDDAAAVSSAPGAAFIRVMPDKSRVFVGEQVTVGWYLYLTQNQNRYETITEPHTDGFWAEDIPSTNPQGRLSFTEQTMNGRTYNVALLFKKALFPLSAGKLTVTPMEAEVSQVDFFGTPVRARRLKTDPLIIEAMPLPRTGEPAGFDPSNVGKYEISAGVDRGSIAVGDAVTLRIAVKGAGNVRNVHAPALPALPGWKSYEPKVDVAVDPADVVTGTKTVEWLLRAERPGKTTVPRPGAGHVRSHGAALRDGPHRAHRAGRHGRGVQRAPSRTNPACRRQGEATRRRAPSAPSTGAAGCRRAPARRSCTAAPSRPPWWCRRWRGRCCSASGEPAPGCPPTSRATGAGASGA